MTQLAFSGKVIIRNYLKIMSKKHVNLKSNKNIMCSIFLNMCLITAILGLATLPNFIRRHQVLSATGGRKNSESEFDTIERKEQNKAKEEKRLSQ